MRPLTLSSTAGTLGISLSLLLCIPAYVICDLGLRAGLGPAQGMYVHVRTAASPNIQAAPGILIFVRSNKALDAKGKTNWSLGSVELNGSAITIERLGFRVREELARRAQNIVYVSGDDDISWGDVVSVMDLVKTETGCRVVLLGRQYSHADRYPD